MVLGLDNSGGDLKFHGVWELIWFGIKCSQVASSDMILQLFWFHATSPRLHLLPIHFFCNAKIYQMVKPILSSIKTIALVQLEFELKNGPHFYRCQNWFVARGRIFKFLEFMAL